MAIFRKIHTSFWSDTFVQELDNDHKLFYLYLLTNERTKQCGIYEISKRQMSFDLGYSIDKVSKLLKHFADKGKVLYSDSTKELAIKNWNKYNGSTSPKVVSCIKSEINNVKDTVLIEYVNGMYTASQEEQEQEQEQEDRPSDKLLSKSQTIEKFCEWFNEMHEIHTGTKGRYRSMTDTDLNNLKKIRKNYTFDEMKYAFVQMLKNEWVIKNNKSTIDHYLRNDNFVKYLNTKDTTNEPKKFRAAWE